MKSRLVLFLTPVLLVAGLALAQKPSDTTPAVPSADARVIATQKPSYPLDTCPVSNEKLGSMGEAVDAVIDGRLVRLCCASCKRGVEKDKVAIFKSIDDAVVAAQSVGYPTEKCAVCDAKMEKAVNHVAGTRLVRCCSDACVKAFGSDAAKSAEAMKKLNAAWIAALRPKYTAASCPVSGKALDANAVDHLYGTRLVRFCCGGCVKQLETKPDVVMAKVAELQKAAPASAPKEGEKKGG